jgi:4-hydroxybenzoate polyprenyltransferase
VVLILYPYAKRYTPLAHYALGFAQAIAPAGVFIAITGTLRWEILPLAAAVGIWIGSFDIYYALQDVEVDRAQWLHSLPADIGVAPAMWIALMGHLATGALLFWSARIFGMGTAVIAATVAFAALLVVEHFIVKLRPKLIGVAFFTLNGVISAAYSLVVLASRIASAH